MEHFDARVRPRGSVSTIAMRGVLDARADTALRTAYDTATRADLAAILLDFGEVTYINSTGIALIVGILASARKQQVAVLVCGLSEHYQHIFEITRLSDFMQFFPDEEAAVVGLSPTP